MKKLLVITALLVIILSFALATYGSDNLDNPDGRSPLTGESGFSETMLETLNQRRSIEAPSAVTAYVSGGLYGTDGANLYLINKTTGAAALIGPHSVGGSFIGALVFDSAGVLYGISAGSTAQLYTIDPMTGAATAVGPLGIGFVFEGGLSFDTSGQLLGVDQGNAGAATTFSINTTTGAGTIIGPSPAQSRDINGMTLDGSTIYAIDRPSNTLGSVNAATGAYTSIGATGVAIGDAGGLAVDPADGTLYASFASTGGFYTLNKGTGAATLIAINNVDFGLAFAPLDEPAGLYSYSVKFVCGLQPEPKLERASVRPGDYATEINIHNYHDVTVTVRKHLLPVVLEGEAIGREPKFVPIMADDGIGLPPNTMTMDDCYRIGELLYGSPPPDPMPITIGFLEIVSEEELSVNAVYTVLGLDGTSVSVEVEPVEGKIK